MKPIPAWFAAASLRSHSQLYVFDDWLGGLVRREACPYRTRRYPPILWIVS
jgi:hypothetical protein